MYFVTISVCRTINMNLPPGTNAGATAPGTGFCMEIVVA